MTKLNFNIFGRILSIRTHRKILDCLDIVYNNGFSRATSFVQSTMHEDTPWCGISSGEIVKHKKLMDIWSTTSTRREGE